MTSSPSSQVLALQALLREQFPMAQARVRNVSPPSESLSDKPLSSAATGSPGEIREIVAERPGCGGALVIGELLEHSLLHRRPLALVDGKDSFDPESYGAQRCHQLLWLRCQNAEQALQATDLLLRDGNLPRVLLDLQLNPAAELRALPASAWHRFRSLAEQSGATLVVLSPAPLVISAHHRIVLRPPSLHPIPADSPRLAFSKQSRVEWIRCRSFPKRSA